MDNVFVERFLPRPADFISVYVEQAQPLLEVIVSLSRDLHGPVASKPYARGWLISEIYFFWNKVRRSRP